VETHLPQDHNPELLNTAPGPARPFLRHAAEIVREELQVGRLVRPDCCILATAVLIDVLDYFKVKARALAVEAWIANPLMHERMLVEGCPSPEDAERSWFPQGAYALSLGGGDPEPGKWPGHLVAVLEGQVLADLTLDQANRPQYGIVLPVPVLASFDPEFLTGAGALVGVVNGCRVEYTARPTDRSFQKATDWQARKRRSSVVAAAIRRLKQG
jgi:hypothetical protein